MMAVILVDMNEQSKSTAAMDSKMNTVMSKYIFLSEKLNYHGKGV